MCGIIGYNGKKDIVPVLIGGLERLEYRGYDSAGIATVSEEGIDLCRCAGKIAVLKDMVKGKKFKGRSGIGHTRWATHGRPSEENAHPHVDCRNEIVMVHNGIIENYLELKARLEGKGHRFSSDTDTEVIVHLIEEYYRNGLGNAIRKALGEIVGSYALGVASVREPQRIYGARSRSPLVIGKGEGECFLASDIPAILKYTRKVVYLNDGEICVLENGGYEITDMKGKRIRREPVRIEWNLESAEKQGYAHFMLKEIFEQPRALEETLNERFSDVKGEIYFNEIGMKKDELRAVERIIITACGTSWHAGLVGEYFMEENARLPVEVEYAAEFRYRDPVLDRNCLVMAISQSGETADTLAISEVVRAKKAKMISICNVVGSSLARESDGIIYTRAGPEIGVASTKAFTTQMAVLYLFSLYLGKVRGFMSPDELKRRLFELRKLPSEVDELLRKSGGIRKLAEKYYKSTNFLYLGRGVGYPIAMEGALKLKEISYIHAEGMPAAEMKHGPIALIDRHMPTVVLAFKGKRYSKIVGNIEEIKSRGGRVIALATTGDDEIKRKADDVIYIPDISAELSPIIAVVPLQLLAYHIAVKRKCEIDQPRNLAKSVTVE